MMFRSLSLVLLAIFAGCPLASAQILDKQRRLQSETFWDNRDFAWYAKQIPFFECPDPDITTTYYYRWDLLTKHLTYGSPNSGYSFTEFIDRPFWSGAYGAISCPAGFQLYEARWLRSPRIANDYSKYWFRTPGAQPRNYSTWLADSVWEIDKVHPNRDLLLDLLPDLIRNFEAWEQRQFVPEVGLFWQTGHDDGMEFNINSRQTQDILRGAPSYRPSFNTYMWADAQAIAHIATLANQGEVAETYRHKAANLRQNMLERMWDPRRQFFFPVLRDDEERDGHQLKALTRTYESGQFAGSLYGRELIGYVPWQFKLLTGETPYDQAWKKLMDRDGFYADFGPSTVERNDPMFLLQNWCCWWSGQSWPYATTQTLKGLANFLQSGGHALTSTDYVEMLGIYARSHRKDGRPYLAEALHPDTGSFEGHDGYNHSEHYLHSGYCDLVITGLIGLIPRADDTLELHPLAPADWDYFALDDVPYRGYLLSIVWDKSGQRYGMGSGLHILVDGEKIFSSEELSAVELPGALPLRESPTSNSPATVIDVNFAVNNDGHYYPRLTASFTAAGTSLSKLQDGNYWYLLHPPNRWTSQGSPQDTDWIEMDLGVPREIHTVQLYVLDDRSIDDSWIRAPERIVLESWDGATWQPLGLQSEQPAPEGGRPHVFHLEPTTVQRLRMTLVHVTGFRSGLTEIEVWGPAQLPLVAAPPPAGNLAYNDGQQAFPRATASHHDRFGGVPRSAIDGITNFSPTPTNRWTSYESKATSDWLQIDFGQPTEFRRVELGIYDDRGGVQPPDRFEIQYWDDQDWVAVEDLRRAPEQPVGSQWNSAAFRPVTSRQLRIVFTHRGDARSGVTEVMVWND